jgi:two-component system nitrate/nitrite response regulator NarL
MNEPQHAFRRRRPNSAAVERELLTPRERQVMLLAAKGLPNKTIGEQLKVTEGTVKLHLHRIYRKLGINSRFALAALVSKLAS